LFAESFGWARSNNTTTILSSGDVDWGGRPSTSTLPAKGNVVAAVWPIADSSLATL
jgi:hypothetical protein